ncbi:phage portal protein [Caldanaerobius polysaccharolyticus]|nr:phage portal protein [Caldanaerobius polysaccharolyticus]
MTIWEKLKLLFKRKPKNTVLTLNEDDELLLQVLGISTNDYSGKNSLKIAVVFAAIKILSEAIAKLPLKIYQDQGGKRKAIEHYLYPLLKLRPNPYMTAFDFWKCVESQRNVYGNAFVWLEMPARGRNAGKITALWPLPADKVQIWVDDKGIFNTQSRIFYVFTDNLGNQYKLLPDEILHFKGFSLDGIAGISPLEYLRRTVETAGNAEEFLNKSLEGGMTVRGIVHYIGDLNPEAEQKFREKFEQMANGLQNVNRIALLPIGYQFQPIALTMSDAQFLENTQLTIRQIATAFGIKNHQLNDLDRATHTNIFEQENEFYIDTLLPILTMYEQEMTYKLFTDSEIAQGYYVKFNVDAVLRADIKTRYEAYKTAIQSGFLTPNEVREMEEREPLQGGDKLLVNGNMMPIEMAGQQYLR